MMFGTKRKLVIANAFFGTAFLILSCGFYGLFIYRVFNANIFNISLAILLLLAVSIIVQIFVLKTRRSIYNKILKRSNKGMFVYFIGTAFGSFVLKLINDRFGKGGESIFITAICLISCLILLYAGLAYIIKSYMIMRCDSRLVNIEYGDTY